MRFILQLVIKPDPGFNQGEIQADSTEGMISKKQQKAIDWTNAQICIDKPKGFLFAEGYFFSQALSNQELEQLSVVCGQEKTGYENMKKIARHRR